MRFEARKRSAIERLAACGADADIIDVLERINRIDGCFTTSSCSGRIVLLRIPHAGAKKDAKFIAKWHRTVTVEEVMRILSNAIAKRRDEIDGIDEIDDDCADGRGAADDEIWLLSQPPIIHVVCRDVQRAREMLSVAFASGFKYSSVKSLAADGIVVEILSTERMDVPICKGSEILCSKSYIAFVVSRANFLLDRGKSKIRRLRENLHVLAAAS